MPPCTDMLDVFASLAALGMAADCASGLPAMLEGGAAAGCALSAQQLSVVAAASGVSWQPPAGVGVDEEGGLMVADSKNHRVCLFSAEGRSLIHFILH